MVILSYPNRLLNQMRRFYTELQRAQEEQMRSARSGSYPSNANSPERREQSYTNPNPRTFLDQLT
jgi:hypothetical protein